MGVYKKNGFGNVSVAGIGVGEEVYIRWDIRNGGDFSWDLAVEDYVEGDICSLAAAAVEGINTTSSAPYWFSFTVPEDGDLSISSYGTATNDTYLKVYSSCFENNLLAYNDDFNDTYQSELSFPD